MRRRQLEVHGARADRRRPRQRVRDRAVGRDVEGRLAVATGARRQPQGRRRGDTPVPDRGWLQRRRRRLQGRAAVERRNLDGGVDPRGIEADVPRRRTGHAAVHDRRQGDAGRLRRERHVHARSHRRATGRRDLAGDRARLCARCDADAQRDRGGEGLPHRQADRERHRRARGVEPGHDRGALDWGD